MLEFYELIIYCFYQHERIMQATKKTLFSGIQPSGEMSIGHYMGVIRHWLRLQDECNCLFSIVDLHALTVRQDPRELHKNCLDLMAWYLACGLDPNKSILFAQSNVAAHSQLSWILNCSTHMGELNRMTQFKDKSQQHEKNINVGLFSYPVLMASDILLYKTDVVPVGDDQKQHLELSRDIAARFNSNYGDVFTIPKPMIAEDCSRIMSLQDPHKKMSKSDPNQNSAILLSDAPDLITKKIKRAVTDSEAIVAYDDSRPGISNLVALYSSLTGVSHPQIASDYTGKGYGAFKSDLADALVATLAPLQDKYKKYRDDEVFLKTVMQQGASAANEIAVVTLQQVMDAIGLVR
jgi:tryptophanyl-tRNA synthetase